MRDNIYSNINEAAYYAKVARKEREYRRQRTLRQLVEAYARHQEKKKTARCGDTDAVNAK